MLLSRDPKDWKNQDHYAVLGLSKYRWKATDEQIKKAHRKKVLKHHPDKKAAAGAVDDDNFFKCIQKGITLFSIFFKNVVFALVCGYGSKLLIWECFLVCIHSDGNYDRPRQTSSIRFRR